MSLPAYALNRATFPRMYERHLVGPLFRPWALALLEEAGLCQGERVLDVACGTGIVARLAREQVGPRGSVVAVDVSAPMLQVARDLAPDVDWREGNASALPLRAAEIFDVIFCQQGLQFFSDRVGAAREMRRALAPGGRLAVSTWRPIEEAPVFRETHRIAERLLGRTIDQRHALGDEGALARLLVEARFDDVRCRKVALALHFADPSPFVWMNAMALVAMSDAAKRMDEAEREQAVDAIARESLEAIDGYVRGGELAFDTVANVATASSFEEQATKRP